MGWMGFDFGRVIRHLQSIGVTYLRWDGKNLTWDPPTAQVHHDVQESLRRSGVTPVVISLGSDKAKAG